MKTQAHVKIIGKVQGVWYRASTKSKAEQLGLTGWVKNASDGSVEAVFEGDENVVEEMIAWCRNGPSLAQVQDVQIKQSNYKGVYEDFSVKYQ